MGINLAKLEKQTTDAVLLAHLLRSGIEPQGVEFVQDYAMPRVVNGQRESGKSPFVKHYTDLNSPRRYAVISQLPMVDASGAKLITSWNNGVSGFRSNSNLFNALIVGNSVQLEFNGKKLTFNAELFLDGVKQLASAPTLLAVDPTNENYSNNVIEWDYGICRRRLRLIEGQLQGSWMFDKVPPGVVRIKYNQAGDFRLKLGLYAVSDDEELIDVASFEKLSSRNLPLVIQDTLTAYPASGQDGYIGINGTATWAAAHDATAGDSKNFAIDFVPPNSEESGVLYYLNRGFLAFDTTLPTRALKLSSTLSLYGNGGYTQANGGQAANQLVEGTQADTPVLADFNNIGSTVLTASNPSWAYHLSGTGYDSATLNATGLALLNPNGVTKFAILCAGDLANAAPTGPNTDRFYSSIKGNGYKPKLVIEYVILTMGATWG